MIALLFDFGVVNADAVNDLMPNYTVKTGILSIPKVGVPSGTPYAYSVVMKLVNQSPLGFLPINTNLLGAIANTDPLSAVYKSDSHSIVMPSVAVINSDGSSSQLTNIQIYLGADPFVWFYKP